MLCAAAAVPDVTATVGAATTALAPVYRCLGRFGKKLPAKILSF